MLAGARWTVALAGLAGLVRVAAGQEVVVETTHGRVRGIRELTSTGRHVTAFYGIPFASVGRASIREGAPPVGELRFLPPAEPARWGNVYDCTRKKIFQVCPQFRVGSVHYGSEDCLYLNIYVPSEQPLNATKLPVFFWIYGGGYVIGDKDEFGWYDGRALASSRNVVVVEPNYRLGALGFMALSALQRQTGGTTGNQALQDQQMALKWAYQNVERFGGVRERLIIAGESAGAMSVCWHYVSQLSRPYFAAAIMESGSCSSPVFFVEHSRSEEFSREVVQAAGCDPTAADADLLKCIREKPLENFFTSGSTWPVPIPGTNHSIVPPLSLSMPWGPTIDGDIRGLPKMPLELIESPATELKPLIIGTNRDEGTLFVSMLAQSVGLTPPLNETGVKLVARHFFNESTAQEAEAEYEGVGDHDDQVAALIRDFMFLCPAQFAAEAISRRDKYAYLYQFVMEIPLWIDYDLLGDYHTIEMSFVFDNQWPPLIHTFGEREKEMASGIGSFWTNLARFGRPSGGPAPMTWPKYTIKNREYMELDIPFRTAQKLEQDVCEFWRTRNVKWL